jgi:hypothetical protein
MTETLIRFPRETDSPLEALGCIKAIVNEAFRHHPNTPDGLFRTLSDMHHLYWLLLKASGRQDEILAAEAAQDEIEKQALRKCIADCIAKYGPPPDN